jgi:hypothetical protein
MTMSVTFQGIEITDVGDVIVTPTVQDPDAGDYVRDVRIFGRLIATGEVGSPEEQALGTTTGPLLLQVRIRALTRESLDFTAPAQNY